MYCFSKSDTRFSSSMLYYGLSLNVGSFGLNIFLTQFIFGIVEIPAVLSNFVLTQRLGRRLSQAGFLFFGGAACLLILAIPKGTEICMLFLLFDFFFSSFSSTWIVAFTFQTFLWWLQSSLFLGNILYLPPSTQLMFILQNSTPPL